MGDNMGWERYGLLRVTHAPYGAVWIRGCAGRIDDVGIRARVARPPRAGGRCYTTVRRDVAHGIAPGTIFVRRDHVFGVQSRAGAVQPEASNAHTAR